MFRLTYILYVALVIYCATSDIVYFNILATIMCVFGLYVLKVDAFTSISKIKKIKIKWLKKLLLWFARL